MPNAKIRPYSLKDDVIIEKPIVSCQFGFHLQFQLGHQLEVLHGIVAIDYHDALRSCGALWA